MKSVEPAGNGITSSAALTNTVISGSKIPRPTQYAIHDATDQSRFFGYLSYLIDDTSRLSFILNAAYSTFQIPDTADLPQVYPLAGVPSYPSQNINENQTEQTYYSAVSYQKSSDEGSIQASAYTSYSQIHYTPDPVGDLIFLGAASNILNGYATSGLQFDGSYNINDYHTLLRRRHRQLHGRKSRDRHVRL